MPCVYQATNRYTGERYIGVSKKTLKQRKSQHFAHARAGRVAHMLFLRAIIRWGERAFEWKVLYETEDYDDAIAAEVAYITAWKPEYNATRGGKGTRGVKRSPEWIAQWNARRHVGPESASRQVVCLDDGSVHPSASSAARAYGVAKSALIEMCIGLRKRRSVGGFHFEYAAPSDEERARYEARKNAPRRCKLDETKVAEIRKLLPTLSDAEIGFRYGVHKVTINDIRSGKTWIKQGQRDVLAA